MVFISIMNEYPVQITLNTPLVLLHPFRERLHHSYIINICSWYEV